MKWEKGAALIETVRMICFQSQYEKPTLMKMITSRGQRGLGPEGMRGGQTESEGARDCPRGPEGIRRGPKTKTIKKFFENWDKMRLWHYGLKRKLKKIILIMNSVCTEYATARCNPASGRSEMQSRRYGFKISIDRTTSLIPIFYVKTSSTGPQYMLILPSFRG